MKKGGIAQLTKLVKKNYGGRTTKTFNLNGVIIPGGILIYEKHYLVKNIKTEQFDKVGDIRPTDKKTKYLCFYSEKAMNDFIERNQVK